MGVSRKCTISQEGENLQSLEDPFRISLIFSRAIWQNKTQGLVKFPGDIMLDAATGPYSVEETNFGKGNGLC